MHRLKNCRTQKFSHGTEGFVIVLQRLSETENGVKFMKGSHTKWSVKSRHVTKENKKKSQK